MFQNISSTSEHRSQETGRGVWPGHQELLEKKLKLEIARLRRPFFLTTGFWIGLITVTLTIPGVYWQHINSKMRAEQQQVELASIQAQLLETQALRSQAIRETSKANEAFDLITRQMRLAAEAGGQVQLDDSPIPRIVGIAFHHQSFDDMALQKTIDSLVELAQLDLRKVSFRGSSITDASLGQIADQPVLRDRIHALDLRDTAIGDAGIDQIARMNHLRELHLKPGGELGMSQVLIRESGIAKLGNLSELETLSIVNVYYYPRLGEASAEGGPLWTPGKTGVTMINRRSTIPRFEVTDQAIANFSDLKKLKSLTLEDAQITDASLPVFAQMQNLSYLNLKSSAVSAEGAELLQKQLKLTRIIPAVVASNPSDRAAKLERESEDAPDGQAKSNHLR